MSEIVRLQTTVTEETRDRFTMLRELPENVDDLGKPATESEMIRRLICEAIGSAVAKGKIPERD